MAKGLRSKIKRGFKKERVALIRAVPYLEAREAKRQAIMDAVMDAPTITEKDATGMEAEATEETVSAPAEDSDVDMAPGVGRRAKGVAKKKFIKNKKRKAKRKYRS